jgi:hypothetical protein
MSHLTSPPVQSKQAAVGSIGFWLFVPIAASLLISVALRSLVSERFSFIGTAAFVYAVFSLIMMTRQPNRFIRAALLIVNLGMILIWGYFQWEEFMPKSWPSWTIWLGVAVAGVLWLVIAYIVISRIGQRSVQSHLADSSNDDEEENVAGGNLSVDVREKIIAALKLTSRNGDVTVDTGELIRQLGLQAISNNRVAAAQMAESIMKAVREKYYDEKDMPAVKAMLRRLQGVPDAPEKESAVADDDWNDSEEPFHPRSVF